MSQVSPAQAGPAILGGLLLSHHLSLHFAVFLFFCAPCVFAGAVLDEFMRNLETAMPGAVGWSVWDNMQTQIQNGSQIHQTFLCQLTNQTLCRCAADVVHWSASPENKPMWDLSGMWPGSQISRCLDV